MTDISRTPYAIAGEVVFCESGHRIGVVAAPLFIGDKVRPDSLTDLVAGLSLESGQRARCPTCGGFWGLNLKGRFGARSAGIVFADGLRLCRQGEVARHYKPVPRTLPDG